MKATMALHRVYFFVVFWFTSWVGYIGFFRPLEILRALPWPAPPLHARFIGALYLGASAFLLLAMFGRSRLQVRTVVDIAWVWTGCLLVITIMHWGMFDFAREQVWFWVVAYIAFPIVAAWLAWGQPGDHGTAQHADGAALGADLSAPARRRTGRHGRAADGGAGLGGRPVAMEDFHISRRWRQVIWMSFVIFNS